MLKKSQSVKFGLNLLRAGWFFHNFLLMTPVIVLIYTSHGITIGDFFLIQGIFRLAAFLFEIPSGYLSDCFSRKWVMVCGGCFLIAGFSAIALATGFWGLTLGEALLGISTALFSGTLEAYTYDLLKRNKTQNQFLKEYGSITTFSSVACFIAALLGGFLYAKLGGNTLLWLEAFFATVSVLFFLFLPNLLEVKRVVKHKTAVVDAISISYRTMKNSRLRNFIVFPALFSAFTIVMLWIMQPIMETAHVPLELFGIFFAINQLAAIFFAKFAYKICGKFGEKNVSIFTIAVIIMGITLGLLATHINSMPLILTACVLMEFAPAIRMLNNLQYNTLIHDSIESNERGTVLSTRAMVSTFLGAIFLSFAKFSFDTFGLDITLVLMFALTPLLFWSLSKVEKHLH